LTRLIRGSLKELEAYALETSRKVPGLGWDAVPDLLNRDRTELEEECLRALRALCITSPDFHPLPEGAGFSVSQK